MNPLSDDLRERCAYECWLLEAVYTITNDPPFQDLDSLIFPADGRPPTQHVYAAANINLRDWRPKFQEVAAPLVLVTAFKVLDMVIEWTLGPGAKHQFSEKIRALSRGVVFDSLIEARPWLKERLIALYIALDPIRGEIIHSRKFQSVGGAIEVTPTRTGARQVGLTANDLYSLAWTGVTLVRCLYRDWAMDRYVERWMRFHLDRLIRVHGLPSFGQKPPWITLARVYRLEGTPMRIDVDAIRAGFAGQSQYQDIVFDVRVVIVSGDGKAVRAIRIPWEALANPAVKHYSIPEDAMTEFATSVPDDVDAMAVADMLKAARGSEVTQDG